MKKDAKLIAVAGKGMAGLNGVFDDQARERDVHFIWVQQDLMD